VLVSAVCRMGSLKVNTTSVDPGAISEFWLRRYADDGWARNVRGSTKTYCVPELTKPWSRVGWCSYVYRAPEGLSGIHAFNAEGWRDSTFWKEKLPLASVVVLPTNILEAAGAPVPVAELFEFRETSLTVYPARPLAW